MSEADLWRWLKRAQPHYAEDLHMTRVENRASAGAADVELCLRGVQAWVELKCERLPLRGGPVRPRFQPTQPPWHRRRLLAGGRTLVLLQLTGGPPTRFLVPGHLVGELDAHGMGLDRLREVSVGSADVTAVEAVRLCAEAPLVRPT